MHVYQVLMFNDEVIEVYADTAEQAEDIAEEITGEYAVIAEVK